MLEARTFISNTLLQPISTPSCFLDVRFSRSDLKKHSCLSAVFRDVTASRIVVEELACCVQAVRPVDWPVDWMSDLSITPPQAHLLLERSQPAGSR